MNERPPSDAPSSTPPVFRPGWYPDPIAKFELRYHNGQSWTGDVSSNGVRYVDAPLLGPTTGFAAPTPPAPHRPPHLVHGAASGNQPAPASGSGKGYATAALVLGICGLATAWMPFVFVLGLIASILAVIFGSIAVRRARSTGQTNGPATAGLITGAIGVPLAVVGVILTIALGNAVDAYDDPGPHRAEIVSCESADGVPAKWTAVASITNLDVEVRSYSIVVAFVRSGTDNVHRSATVEIDDVDPGATVEFTVDRPIRLGDVECTIDEVHGPLPFGLDLDG